MKKIILILAFIVSGAAFLPANAQVHVNINIGSQPVWGPSGYDYVEYYYLPDIQAYYNVPRHQFVYQNRGRWIFSSSLPSRYRNYDLNTGYKVVVNEKEPYRHYQKHQEEYGHFKGQHGQQQIIRNTDDPKYYGIKGHPKYHKDNGKSQGRDNGKSKGQKNGKDKGHDRH